MKKILLLLAIAVLFSTPALAGSIWGMIKNTGGEDREAKQITIEVRGVNIRAYIFDVPEMKSMCISAWGDGEHQLECKTYKEIGMKE